MWRMRGIFGGLCVMRKWRKQQQAETDTDRAGVSYLLKRSLPGEVVQRRGEELLFRQPIALHGVRGWGLVLERIIQVKRNVFRRVSARFRSVLSVEASGGCSSSCSAQSRGSPSAARDFSATRVLIFLISYCCFPSVRACSIISTQNNWL